MTIIDDYTRECLNEHLFFSLKEAVEVIEEWKDDYNYSRPHSSLHGKTPIEMANYLFELEAEEKILTGTSM